MQAPGTDDDQVGWSRIITAWMKTMECHNICSLTLVLPALELGDDVGRCPFFSR